MQRAVLDADMHRAALGQLAKEQLFGERLLDMLLNDPAKRTRAHLVIIALLAKPSGGLGRQVDVDIAVNQLRLKLQDELGHHLHDDVAAQGRKGDDRIQTVAEFRREGALNRRRILALAAVAAKADRRFRHFRRACVRGHDQDHIAEIHRPAVVVGQLAVVHHLQQDVVDIRVRLFHFVQQEDAMRVLIDAIRQHAALIEPNIARRGADQAADRVLFHVFRHVKAQKFHAKRRGQLLGHLGLAHARRPGEEIVADGLFRLPQPRAGQFDGRAQRLNRFVLPEHHAFQRLFKIAQRFGIILGHRLGRDAGDFGHHSLNLLHAQGLAPLAFGQKMLRGTRLVDHINRRIRQLAVVDIARRQFDGRFDRVIGVAQIVVILKMRLQPHQDLDRIVHRRLIHVDLLEPARQRAVLLKVLAEFLVGGRAHAAQLAALQRGFQQVRGIHRPATGGPGPNHRMDFVDEQDRIRVIFQLFHHLLQAFLKVTAIAGSGQERAHVQRIDRGTRQNIRGLLVDDLFGQTFGDGGLANTRIAHQQGVVLAPTAQNLNRALHLSLAADQRVNVALQRLDVQIDAELRQGGFLGLSGLGLRGLMLFGPGHFARLAVRRILGHTMGDEIHRIIARHVLFLQEVGGVRFALGKDRDQHIGPGHLIATGRLHMDRRALNDALEGRRWHRLGPFNAGDQRRQIVVDEIDQGLFQLIQINRAGLHHAGCVRFFDQRQKKMLQRGQLMSAGIGQGQCRMDRLLQCGRE